MMSHTFSRSEILFSTLLVEGGLAFSAIVLAWMFGPELWTSFHWTWDGVLWGVAGAVPPLIVILAMDRYPIGPLKHVADISERFLRPLLKNCRWPDYFLLATLAGFCEELLFRGWLQPFLAESLSLWVSVVIGGFIFALCHMITPAYFIIAWLISMYLALLLIWTDNLLVPMLTHGVYDLIAIFVVMWPVKHEPGNASDPGSHSELIMLPSVPHETLPVEPSPSSGDKAPDSDA